MSEHNAGNAQEKPALVPVSPAPLVELVLDGLASPHSRRAYRRALGEFFSWYPSNAAGEGFTRATVQRYRSHLAERSLSAASINLALAAIRKLATEAASNELLSPVAAAAIRSVGGARRTGIRTGNWLTLPQAQQLLAAPDPATAKGLRDRVLLGLLVGSGLRRGELAGLGFDAIAQREGRWAIVDLVGKHGRVRTVPMPSWAKAALDGWAAAAGIDSGPVLRRVSKAGRVGPGPLGAQSIFETVAATVTASASGSRRTTCAAPSPSSPTRAARRSSRSRSASATPRSRPPSATWASGRTSTTPPATGWGSWAGRGDRGGQGAADHHGQGREARRGGRPVDGEAIQKPPQGAAAGGMGRAAGQPLGLPGSSCFPEALPWSPDCLSPCGSGRGPGGPL